MEKHLIKKQLTMQKISQPYQGHKLPLLLSTTLYGTEGQI